MIVSFPPVQVRDFRLNNRPMHVNYLKHSIADYDLLLTTLLTKHDLCRLYKN